MRISINHPDNLGATFSLLCILHCYATPFLFITQSYIATVPGWWQALNFLFLSISFFAIYRSVQNSTNFTVKSLLFLFWCFLAFLLISEEIELFHLPEILTYGAGFTLASLHIYNKKYCQCNDGECCVDK
tara:strand:+ start:32 stop:421 length:390 start_codon:yes stop_codon:yes gene_type:complete